MGRACRSAVVWFASHPHQRCSLPRLPCLALPGRLQIFAGPLAGGARAVVLANMQTTQSQYPISNITVLWEQIGLQPGQRCRVRELYAGEQLRRCVGEGRGWPSGLGSTCSMHTNRQQLSMRPAHTYVALNHVCQPGLPALPALPALPPPPPCLQRRTWESLWDPSQQQ